MRRSAHVFAPLLAATAVAVTGCHNAEPQRCVDEANHVVEPKFCANLPPGSQQPLGGNTTNGGGTYGNGGIFYPHMYRYYYGGLGGYALGSIVSGGGYAPLTGHTYGNVRGGTTSISGTSRGGFGSSFSSSGGHGGEGGGGE